jgi:hypothetical protein
MKHTRRCQNDFNVQGYHLDGAAPADIAGRLLQRGLEGLRRQLPPFLLLLRERGSVASPLQK